MSSLAVIPAFVRTPADLEVLVTCLRSIQRTSEVDVLVVDDGSPEVALVDELLERQDELGFELVRQPTNEGFSRTVNVGLQRALTTGRDAILINADVEMMEAGWAELMEGQLCLHKLHEQASVVGALLLFPNGLIQHAGVYFSLLARSFDHLFKYGPFNLPEALVPSVRPVTAALQFIRHECLASVGVYDETFRMGFEDVDYCLRVLLSGRECVYQPEVCAWHHEMLFRGHGRSDDRLKRWQAESFLRLLEKYQHQSFAELVPTL